MANDALIGHTGYVGGELARQRQFAASFNSANIRDIRGRTFDTLICCGVTAVKWLANKEPEKDWSGIASLLDCLEGVKAARFILISTIDVYRETANRTERDIPPTEGLHPYGTHRLKVEAFVRERFPVHTIVRLPALFGAGLKKNALFDMIHRNQPEKVVPNAVFQWYPTRRLAADIDVVAAADIDLINVTTEPVAISEIHDRFFPDVTIGAPVDDPPRYDLRSIHDTLLGGRNGYHLSRDQVFEELASFVASVRESR